MRIRFVPTTEDAATVARWFDEDPTLSAAIGGRPPDLMAWLEARLAVGGLGLVEDPGLVGVVTIHPRFGDTGGVGHILLAPNARGRGVAIARFALDAAKTLGFTVLAAPEAPEIPVAVHQRWLRQVGFTIHHHGEWYA